MPKKEESSRDESDEINEFSSENVCAEDPIQTSTNETEVVIKKIEENDNTKLGEKKKSIRKIKYPKVIFYVNETQYPVVKAVGKKVFKWKLTMEQEDDWDVCWTDMAVQPETLSRMKPYQKINHFPGMYSLARKNYLGRNLMKMLKQFPDDYKFFPETWMLPSEMTDFRKQFEVSKENGKKRVKTFIVKPEASSQGKGIYLIRNLDEIPAGEHCVVQRYKTQPHLIDGLKYDLRIYVLVAGCDPLRIYVYKEGLARFATEEYVPPNNRNLQDICMHLTNYAINKNSPNFIFNNDQNDFSQGHKRSYTYVLNYLREMGEDVDKLQKEIHDIFIKTLCCGQPILAHNYKSCQPDNHINNMCFEVLGMDILLDHKLKPYLLEVNHTPSFTTDTPLDKSIKKGLIRDSLLLMDINGKNKVRIKNNMKAEFQRRVIGGKKEKLTVEARQELVKQMQLQRDSYEDVNSKNFTKIYPPKCQQELEQYQSYQEFSLKVFQDMTGANVRRNTKKSQETVQQDMKNRVSSNQGKSDELTKIYSKQNKLKVSRKYDSVKSKVQCHYMFYKKEQENEEEKEKDVDCVVQNEYLPTIDCNTKSGDNNGNNFSNQPNQVNHYHQQKQMMNSNNSNSQNYPPKSAQSSN